MCSHILAYIIRIYFITKLLYMQKIYVESRKNNNYQSNITRGYSKSIKSSLIVDENYYYENTYELKNYGYIINNIIYIINIIIIYQL